MEISRFTNSGLALLSGASATEILIIDQIFCLTTAASASDIDSQPVSYWEGLASSNVSAQVISAGSDPNSTSLSRIVFGITNTGSADITVKTIVITGHLSSGVEGTFWGGSDSSGLVIPYNASIPVSINFALSFAFNRASSITVSGSVENYLLADEVERFVTVHKTGDETAGDSQTILGDKTFYSDKTSIDGEGSLYFAYDEAEYGLIATDDYGLKFKSLTNTPSEGTLFRWMTSDDEPLASIGVDQTGAFLSVDRILATHAQIDTLGSDSTELIRLDQPLVPYTNGVSIGTTDQKFNKIYASTVTCDSLDSASGLSISTTTDFYDSVSFNEIVEFHEGAKLPVFKRNPSTSEYTCPVGGLVLARLRILNWWPSGSQQIHAGSSITISRQTTATDACVASSIAGDTTDKESYWYNSDVKIPAGTYTLLNSSTTSGGDKYCTVLLQRVS